MEGHQAVGYDIVRGDEGREGLHSWCRGRGRGPARLAAPLQVLHLADQRRHLPRQVLDVVLQLPVAQNACSKAFQQEPRTRGLQKHLKAYLDESSTADKGLIWGGDLAQPHILSLDAKHGGSSPPLIGIPLCLSFKLDNA